MTSQLVHVLWMLYHRATEDLWQAWRFNPFPPNVIIHILHTVLYTFPRVLTRRICLLIKSFLVLIIISLNTENFAQKTFRGSLLAQVLERSHNS